MADIATTLRPAAPLPEALRLGCTFAVAKLVLQFALTLRSGHLGYSYFRDEFYYLACGHHLDWGFVDHGPIVAVQARLGEALFGTGVFAVRILSALAGAGMMLLTGMLAWALGGLRPAQSLAMLAIICCPQFIGTDGYLSMNSFEPIFWGTCVLLLTVMLALPNLLWQMHNHWPTLEFLSNGRERHKNVLVGPVQFFLTQCSSMQPLNTLLWVPGVFTLLRAKSIRGLRRLDLTYCFSW